MGISSDKAMVLARHPTTIVAGIHEVRIALPELAQRLAQVSRMVGPARSIIRCHPSKASARIVTVGDPTGGRDRT